jgi:hypothetical protein
VYGEIRTVCYWLTGKALTSFTPLRATEVTTVAKPHSCTSRTFAKNIAECINQLGHSQRILQGASISLDIPKEHCTAQQLAWTIAKNIAARNNQLGHSQRTLLGASISLDIRKKHCRAHQSAWTFAKNTSGRNIQLGHSQRTLQGASISLDIPKEHYRA